MFYINKQGGARSSSTPRQEAIRLWEFCIAHSIHLVASFLPGVQNTLADRLSRSFQVHEWAVHPDVIHSVFWSWGFPCIDLFATCENRKCHVFCSLQGHSPGSLTDAFFLPWTDHLSYAFSPISARPQGPAQAAQGQSPPNHDRPGVAQAALVHHSPRALGGHPNHSPVVAGSDYSGARQALPPRPAISPSHGVAAAWLNKSELRCSSSVQQVLLGSRKPSTRSTYLAKWKCFSCWCAPRGTAPLQAPVPIILDYLLSLKQQGLAISSLKFHLAAISAFHPGENGRLIFSNPMVSRFLKGLERLYPLIRHPVPTWDLSLVITRFMGAPFEPMATCSLLYLSWKTTFLVAITSARRVSEIRALTSEPPYMVFHKDKVRYSCDHTRPSSPK
ncbi:uncharacterized protein RBU57_016237 [Macrochelys suwanniensis]